jgi:homoserine dehydrogenase
MSARAVSIGAVPGAAAVRYVRVEPRTRVLRIALAGCGVVGGALVRLLRERGAEIEATRGLRLELARVLVRDPTRPRGLELAPGLLTSDAAELLGARADVLVEAIGGLDPAERLARETLARGRAVVTANKELVAAAGAELAALAKNTGATFDFEAAVAGGVPVVRALRGALGESGLVSVRGTLNGTTNFLLGRLLEGAGYPAALAEAREKGFAEADPSRDLDGRDAAAKLAILAWLAFGADPATLRVRRRGLLPDPELLARAAALFGGVPKLVCECVRLPRGIAASVEPAVVDAGSELAGASGEHNLVVLESRWNGRIRLAGPGAGGMPTASALLWDVLGSAGGLRSRPAPGPGAPVSARDDRALPTAARGIAPTAPLRPCTLPPARRQVEAGGISRWCSTWSAPAGSGSDAGARAPRPPPAPTPPGPQGWRQSAGRRGAPGRGGRPVRAPPSPGAARCPAPTASPTARA